MHLGAINSYVCFLYLTPFFFGLYQRQKYTFLQYQQNFISSKNDDDTLLQCSNPNNTTYRTNENHKKQHSGKMKSNHHLPECDSVFFSSEKKKSDSEFIFFFSEFISPSLRSIATKAPEVPVQLFRVFPF